MTRIALGALVALTIAARARAGESAVDEADKLFKEGRRAAESNEYARACRLFEESFRLDPAIGTLVNLGDCAEHLGDLERAFTAYKTAFARMAPNDDRMARVRGRIDAIEAHSAKLTVKLDDDAPEGTVVTLDGATIDPKKSPLRVAKGAHVVLVTAVGFRGERFAITLAEKESRSLRVTPGAALEAVLPTSAPSEPSHVPSWTLPTSIVALGAGVASAWVGSLAGLVAIDRRDVERAGCNAQNQCTQAGYDAAHDGATWATTSTAAFVASGVLLAAGGALLVVALSRREKNPATIAFGPRGFMLEGRFE